MGLNEYLAGLKPESVDTGFDNLKGVYKMKVKAITVNEANQYIDVPHYKIDLEVLEVLDGNGSPGRTLRRNYAKAEMPSEKASKTVKNLVNDLFTAGLSVDSSSVEALEASFESLRESIVYVKAYGWKPQPDSDEIQMWNVKAEKNVKKLIEKASATPF